MFSGIRRGPCFRAAASATLETAPAGAARHFWYGIVSGMVVARLAKNNPNGLAIARRTGGGRRRDIFGGSGAVGRLACDTSANLSPFRHCGITFCAAMAWARLHLAF